MGDKWRTMEPRAFTALLLGPGRRQRSIEPRGRRHAAPLGALVFGLRALMRCLPCGAVRRALRAEPASEVWLAPQSGGQARALQTLARLPTPGRTVRMCRNLVVAVLASLPGATTARADVITDWNVIMINSLRSDNSAPPLGARNLAILHTAIYDAVNAIDRRYAPYFLDAAAPPEASPVAAAAAAAYQVMNGLFPGQNAIFESAFTLSLANVPPGPARDAGIALGLSTANTILNWRSADGASTSVPYIPSDAPGAWRRTPPFFRPELLRQWGDVRPFAMQDTDQFLPPGPPALTSPRYAEDFNMVKELGAINSATRTAEQTEIARFWADFSHTESPPGHWNSIARDVAARQGNTLEENARLFALLNIAMADAGIVTWDAKYRYNFWRPVTAIREADRDGNPDTVADPGWTPLLVTPNFPEYTSGHSTFSAAAAEILRGFYGTDAIHFTALSDTLPGVTRTYDSLRAAVDEIGLSRVYGGIHFLSGDIDGIESGEALGKFVFDNFLVPIPEPTAIVLLGGGLAALAFARFRRRPT